MNEEEEDFVRAEKENLEPSSLVIICRRRFLAGFFPWLQSSHGVVQPVTSSSGQSLFVHLLPFLSLHCPMSSNPKGNERITRSSKIP